jgi:heme/copper-type cytochrome/quinol oxidase subunit 2
MLTGVVMSDVSTVVARTKRNAIFLSIAGLCFLTAYVFLLAAGAVYLSQHYGTIPATLIIAGIFITVAVIIIIVMSGMAAAEKRRAAERRRSSQLKTNVAITTALTVFRRKPLVAAGIAMAAGALLGVTRGRSDD